MIKKIIFIFFVFIVSCKTSFGSLSEVTEGIRKQTSWTFANTCLNRYESNKSSSWDATNTYLWKIQRK